MPTTTMPTTTGARRLAALLLPALALTAIAARKPDDPKHENHFAPGTAPASDLVSIQVQSAQAQSQFIFVDTKITNKTADQLVVVKKGEASFVLPSGPVATRAGGLFGDTLFIPPGETRSYTFRAEGDAGFHVDEFTLKAAGLYVAPNTGKPVSAPDFQLPPSKNEFTAGPYTCKLGNVEQETKKTAAAFACTYSGKGLGIVEPQRVGVREPGGKEFANVARKAPRDVLLPGGTSKFVAWFEIPANVADMQFATLQVLFRDALTESAMSPLSLGDWTFTLDAAKTADANK